MEIHDDWVVVRRYMTFETQAPLEDKPVLELPTDPKPQRVKKPAA